MHSELQALSGITPTAAAQSPTQPSSRLLWADLIRVYAMVSVVLLHCEAVPNTQFGQIPMGVWWQTNIYNAFVCTCVPLFVMLSGALILTRDSADDAAFLRRRVGRLLVPLLAWTLIYAAWYRFAWGQPLSLWDLFIHFISGLSKPLFAHLWFLYLIISLYLAAPLLRIYFRHSALPSQAYFIALWFVATGIKPLLAQQAGIDLGLYLDPFFGFIGYFLLGATLTRFLPERAGPRLLVACWAIVLAGYTVNLFGTYALSLAAGKLDDYFYQHIAPTVMLMSPASFVLLRHYGSRLAAPAIGLTFLSRLTFGIYLSHALVIVLLESGYLGFKLYPTMLPPLLAAPLLATLVFFASAVLTGGLQRMPLLRRLVP
jgi:surface polysaccharide O-acyltransferase-like enzyme